MQAAAVVVCTGTIAMSLSCAEVTSLMWVPRVGFMIAWSAGSY